MRATSIGAAALLVLVLGGCGVPRWPAEGAMTSPYGLRVRSGDRLQVHRGVDIAMPEGTPVNAMAAGRVHIAGWRGSYGLLVVIDHGGSTRTVYAHLSEVRVAEGERVRAGQLIGLSGMTGNATGPHLHFEVIRWGRPEDPVPLLGRAPRKR